MTTRFVIVSSPRCGTHLVGTALSSMQGVGESHEPYNHNNWKHPGEAQGIWDKMWAPARQEKFHQACGFALHRNQGGLDTPEFSAAYAPNATSPWTLLRNDTDIKVIELVRRNWLKRYVSMIVALRTQTWNIRHNAKRHNFALKIDLAELDAFIRENKTREYTCDDYLLHHERIKFSYEDITANPDKAFAALQEFLCLEQEEIAPVVRKQEQRPLREVVTNFDEVSQFLFDEYRCGVSNDKPDPTV